MNSTQKTTHRCVTDRTRNQLTHALVYVILALAILSTGGVMLPRKVAPPVLVSAASAASRSAPVVEVTQPVTPKRRRATRRKRVARRPALVASCLPCCAQQAQK